jgi:hypothetical protein
MKPYDVAAIRARFPSLANTLPDGRPIAFLDGPAGTQVPQSVIDAYADFDVSFFSHSLPPYLARSPCVEITLLLLFLAQCKKCEPFRKLARPHVCTAE